jgi:Regulator of chromosome condensation (RCC1) repeat
VRNEIMNMFLRSGYTGLLVLAAAAPFVSAGCSDDTPLGEVADSGSDADGAVDTGVDSQEDAATDAGADSAFLLDAAPPSIECTTDPCVVDISRGNDHTCALSSTGAVYCWGDNPCGEVGAPIDGTPTDFKPVPAPRQVLSGVRSISAGASSTCAILQSGELRCWGSLVSAFSDGTSGGYNHSCTPNATPTAVAGVPQLTAVSSTMSSGCGVATDGTLWCWGSTYNNLLGRAGYSTCSYYRPCDSPSYPAAPADLVNGKVKDVLVSYGGVFVFDSSNQLWTWGGNAAVGRTSSMAVDPTPLPADLTNINSLSVSLFGDGQYTANNTCAASQGRVYCWGEYRAPTRLIPLPDEQLATQVSASFHACARTMDGSVFCWGSNQAGQLGDGTGKDHTLVPTKVDGLKAKAVKVTASKATSCALLVSGEVQCWGANDKGQLGTGSADFLPHLKPGTTVAFQ